MHRASTGGVIQSAGIAARPSFIRNVFDSNLSQQLYLNAQNVILGMNTLR